MPLRKRGNTFHLHRRVPLRFSELEPRDFIDMTLHTTDRAEAERLAAQEWAKRIKGWKAGAGMASEDEGERYRAAKVTAQAKGFRFMEIDRVAKLPIRDILDRVEACRKPRGRAGPGSFPSHPWHREKTRLPPLCHPRPLLDPSCGSRPG